MPFHDALSAVQSHARSGQFQDLLADCQEIIGAHGDNVDALLDVGALLLNSGFLGHARDCFERASQLLPDDFRPLVNLANLARESGNHPGSRERYASLLGRLPDHPVIRRNTLVSLEYDPDVGDKQRLQHALDWGNWAIAQAGGRHLRPALRPLAKRRLRIAYVSADLCQHTVGLFLKDSLQAHDPERVELFAYSAGSVSDWVTEEIRKQVTFRDVSRTGDSELARMIRQDAIDVLVDLSGHTAGSRLSVFAHRPAPVMVSWLGYFATTGLEYLDAVLLDEWHAPAGMEAQFVEPIMRLPQGRFCYQPVPWAPADVAPLPVLSKGHITFGCFNNTAKLNAEVFELWARILTKVPDSRLILKWRTFNDESLRKMVFKAFTEYRIDLERIELRGPSFHADLLKEYAEIDIALDPFPFTGGLSSCEALWMGVPVVTFPQSRVVSRQGFAFLSAIGLPELAAVDGDDYVRIAVELAGDRERLAATRNGMRKRMRASPLMDVSGFTHRLEQCLIDLHQAIYTREKNRPMTRKTILHVGPGHKGNGARLPPAFQTPEWQEIRFDIDPANEPDILGSMMDMTAVESESMDAIYSAHNIEHVYAHEVPVVLREFLRTLRADAFLVVTCPDLQAVSSLIAEDKLTDPAYQSPAGPITPLDMLYGHGAALATGHHYMAHKCGFTLRTLTAALLAAGFTTVAGRRRARGLDLWVVASKGAMTEVQIRDLAGKVLPA